MPSNSKWILGRDQHLHGGGGTAVVLEAYVRAPGTLPAHEAGGIHRRDVGRRRLPVASDATGTIAAPRPPITCRTVHPYPQRAADPQITARGLETDERAESIGARDEAAVPGLGRPGQQNP